MNSFKQIIDRIGGHRVLAKYLNINIKSAESMYFRSGLPSHFWARLVRESALNENPVTLRMLAEVAEAEHANKWGDGPRQPEKGELRQNA